MDAHFWKSRRVFLTGDTGFKGSWLALWLHSLGAEVRGYALAPPTEPSLYRLLALDELEPKTLRSTRGDVRDLATLEAAMQAAAPEIVFHLAAQPLVRASYQYPVETYATNVQGTVHLLEAVRRTPGVRAIVVVTSDKCYENRERHEPYREDEAMGGHDPYSSSKGCAELVVAAYRRSFLAGKVAVASARAGNVFGGGDWAADRLLPDIVRAFAAGDPVVIRYPEAVRPWQHVLEPLSGYLALAEHLFNDGESFAEAWNFGPEESDARTVRHLVTEATRLWGAGASWQSSATDEPHEAQLLRLDATKARGRLGWRPQWTLDEALVRTIEWYKAYYAGGNMLACTLRQIDEYSRRMMAAAEVSA